MWRIPLWIAAGLALLLLMACLIGFWPIDLAFNLVAGWVFFLWRVSPDIRMTWDGVLTALVSLAGLGVGLHFSLGWLQRQRRLTNSNTEAPSSWPLRWTVMLICLALLMFLAGMSAVGASYQTARFLNSPEPVIHSSGDEIRRRLFSTNHLRNLALGCRNYHDSQQTFPVGGVFDTDGRGLHGWMTAMLPYMDNKELYSRIDLTRSWADPANAGPFKTVVKEYLTWSPVVTDSAGYGLTHFAANTRVLGGDVPITLEQITDGTGETILVGEAAGNYKPWGYPMNWRDPAIGINRSLDGFGSPSPRKGAIFAFADGAAHFLSENIDPQVLKALSTPAGGEKIPEDAVESPLQP
jgi:hypothetical protein